MGEQPLVASLDVQAMARLDHLLALSQEERAAALAGIATENPALYERALELLKFEGATDSSEFLMTGLAAGWQPAEADPADLLQPGSELAGYRLLRELGRGGMSIVWLGERADGSLRRLVALKVPLATLSTYVHAERFAREKHALAQLTHPNVARLLDAGIAPSGRSYIVLEYVDGEPISQYCDRNCLSVPARLALFLQILAAVEHAHAHLIVHRDLKPSNILVDKAGQAKLLDFGIAKLLSDSGAAVPRTQLTELGGGVLTPQYAAPEQIRGDPISTATDVYCAGVVLYELLSGARPHGGPQDAIARVIHSALHNAPPAPSQAEIDPNAALARGVASVAQLRAQLTGDLDTIVLKALCKEPSRRYASADRFADDLRRHLSLRPIKARPATRIYAASLFLRRNLAASLAAMAAVMSIVVFSAIAWQQSLESMASQQRASAVRDFMFDLVYDAEPSETHTGAEITAAQLIEGAVKRARRDFDDAPRLKGELLAELGRVFSLLGDRSKGKALQRQGLALLEASAAPGDSTLNETRAQLADELLQDDQPKEALALASTALSACVARNADCAKARAYAHTTLSQIEIRGGRVEQAVDHMRRAVAETSFAFGPHHEETALQLLNLAVTERNVGRFAAAASSLHQAVAIASTLTLRASDRVRLAKMAAVLDLDLGRYELARRTLAQLLPTTTVPAERLPIQRLIANALLELGEAQGAKDAAEDAVALGGPDADELQVNLARQAHARAQALLWRHGQASNEIDAIVEDLQKGGHAADSVAMLAARRARAEILARAGKYAEAALELEALIAGPEPDRSGGPEIERSRSLDLLGCVRRELKDLPVAITLHSRARALLQRNLPEDHPLLRRNTLYASMARMLLSGSAADRQLFDEEVERYLRDMPPASVWRTILSAPSGEAVFL